MTNSAQQNDSAARYFSLVHIVVTGSSRGFGAALVAELASRGHQVCATLRTLSDTPVAPNVKRVKLDVTQQADCEALARELDTVDCLVSSAAIGTFGPLSSDTHDQILRTFDTNAVGAFRVTHALLAHLKKSRGRVFFVSSDMGSLAGGPPKGDALAYRMSKVAMNMLGASFAAALHSDGVACMCVHPGWLRTEMGGAHATDDVVTTAQKFATLIETRGMESTGTFLNIEGVVIPW